MQAITPAEQIICNLLYDRTGQEIAPSRRWRIHSALAGLFREFEVTSAEQLACLLSMPGQDRLADRIVEALLNNETYFFRDPAYFDVLANTVLPTLHERKGGCRQVRIWSAGCSTGQEALSLAMLFVDQVKMWDGWDIEILGTDISKKAIKRAKTGTYSQFEIQRGLGVKQMLHHFTDAGNGWHATDKLRGLTRFKVRSLLDPPPPERPFDLVLCRNVMLYFSPHIRVRAFERLAQGLSDTGMLMLGAGEHAPETNAWFEPKLAEYGLFRKRANQNRNSSGFEASPIRATG